jgi:hypothetical protein
MLLEQFWFPSEVQIRKFLIFVSDHARDTVLIALLDPIYI